MMNKLIQQLAEQALAESIIIGNDEVYRPVGYQPIVSKAFADRFAELIVKKCAKFLEDNSGYDQCNNAWHPEPEELLEHFGVEE